jgi:hypothetical protein
MYTAIVATSQTLRQHLAARFAAETGPFGLAAFFSGANAGVWLDTPHELEQAGRQGLSLWLYRVVRDEHRLNDPPTRRRTPAGATELVPPPLPLRLHYLATPLAPGSAEMEQRVLGKVLQVFHTRPTLAGADLRGDLAGTTARLHVRLEPMALEEISRVWDALEGSYQLSVSYEVTLIDIDVDAEPLTAAPVETVVADYAVIVGQEP